jgi:large-conductance mechanosensitive channel
MSERKKRAVMIYVDPEIHKMLRQQAIDWETTAGSCAEEAIVAWFKWIRVKEIEVMKDEAEKEKREKKQKELEEIHAKLAQLRNDRKSAIEKRKGKKK